MYIYLYINANHYYVCYITVGVIIIIPTFILSYYSIPIICFFHQRGYPNSWRVFNGKSNQIGCLRGTPILENLHI